MMAIAPISVATLLPPIATHKVTDFAIIMLKSCVISWYSVVLFTYCFFPVHWGSWCIDWTKQCFLRSIQPFFRLFITKNGSEAYVMFKWGSPELQKGLTWYAKEAYLEFKWGSLDSGQDVSKITSRRICYCVGTYKILHRDVQDATSGRNFGNTKNAWVSLFLWQYMADYGNSFTKKNIKVLL